MRKWLTDNLVLNLERRFQCVTPSKLFPVWMADARLRGDGSVKTKVKFQAIHQPNPASGSDDRRIDSELRSIVGRMLWQEVWGNLVTANAWWWQDQQCVKECLQLGTYFEYFLIEGVKDTSG
jgi:hypothetical protein